MIITPGTLQATRIYLDKRFNDAYQAVAQIDLWYSRLATDVPSTGAGVNYNLAQLFPRLRKWVGARQLNNVKHMVYQLLNETYEGSVEVEVNDLADDNLSTYNAIMAGLGRAAKLWPNDLVFGAMVAGGAGLCYDGQPFFNGSHPLEVQGGATITQSNLHTSMPLTAANFGTVRQRMLSIKGEDGKPVGVKPTTLVVPPELEITGRRILQAGVAGSLATSGATASDDNIYKGMAELLVIPELSADSATTWYLADDSKPVKPLVFQQRQTPDQVIAMDRATDENVFMLDKAVYGVKGRGNAGYGLWQLMAKCTA